MIIEEVKVQTGESIRTVKDLRKELKDLKDQLLNTAQGTEEYAEALQKAANIQKELKDQMEEVNNSAMDFGQVVGNTSKVFAGLSGAITAATGVLSLFGVENEEVQKKITATMTSLIGITQGLAAIDNGVKAYQRLNIALKAATAGMNKFKIALIGTGIGAIVVLLGSLIAYWDEFSEAIGLSSEKMQKFGDIAKGVFNVITSSLKGIVSALGKVLKGDFKGAWEELKNGFAIAKNFNEGVANAQAKREEEQTKKAKEEADKRAKIAEEEYKKRIAAAEKLAKYEKDMAQAKLRGDDADKYSEESRKIQERYFERMFKVYKKDSEEYKNLVLEKEQWLQDWENHFIEEANKETEANNKKTEEEKKARQKTLEDFNNSLKTERQLLDERYQMLIDAATLEGEDTTAILEWYEKEKTRIKKEEEEKRSKKQKEEAEEREETEMEEYKAKARIASYTGDIIDSIGSMMEEGTKQQQGMAIAATTIHMLAGIAEALACVFTTHSGTWDIPLAIAQAASIAASGIASIAKIKQVKPDGSGPTSASAPSVSIPTVINTSSDFSQSVDGAMTRTSIRDQKVYVLEHDITETQNKVSVAEARASY